MGQGNCESVGLGICEWGWVNIPTPLGPGNVLHRSRLTTSAFNWFRFSLYIGKTKQCHYTCIPLCVGDSKVPHARWLDKPRAMQCNVNSSLVVRKSINHALLHTFGQACICCGSDHAPFTMYLSSIPLQHSVHVFILFFYNIMSHWNNVPSYRYKFTGTSNPITNSVSVWWGLLYRFKSYGLATVQSHRLSLVVRTKSHCSVCFQ